MYSRKTSRRSYPSSSHAILFRSGWQAASVRGRRPRPTSSWLCGSGQPGPWAAALLSSMATAAPSALFQPAGVFLLRNSRAHFAVL